MKTTTPSSNPSTGSKTTLTPALKTKAPSLAERRQHKQSVQPLLNTCLEELCGNTGLYARNTFQGLSAAILRLTRSQQLQGLIITRTVTAEEQERLALLLKEQPGLQWFPVEHCSSEALEGVCSEALSLLVVLTDKLSAMVYWNANTEARFNTLQGGWSFHPGETRRLALQLQSWLNHAGLQQALETTPADRRFDEPLTLLISSLVDTLEGRNRELSLALTRENQLNEKMLQTERLAAIGQLCSVIAHEIRNPLGLIGLYAKLAEGQLQAVGVEDATLNSHLNQITDATEALESILSQLTQYSRPIQLKQEVLSLEQWVPGLLQFMQPAFNEKNVCLVFNEVPEPLPLVAIDTQRLRQALLNLLKNALEASQEGQTVTVSLSSRLTDEQVFIKVQDQGSGINEENQARLFTPYFSTKQQGTGLGLAEVRKILQAHGGNALLLQSEVGVGSTFALSLPKKSGGSE